jgi:hypothetical protein
MKYTRKYYFSVESKAFVPLLYNTNDIPVYAK